MSSVPLMEWNAKPPLQWDWENLATFNTATTENSKKLCVTELEIDVEGGIGTDSLYSSRGGSGSGDSCSYKGFTSLSKSSKSGSVSSSSIGEVRASKFTPEASDTLPEDLSDKKNFEKGKPFGTSPPLEASAGSREPLLGLKLGKRTYFEDVCAGSNSKTSFSMLPMSSSTTGPGKRSKSGCQEIHAPRCQVEGCNIDLSSAKDYHRKHRVCESHSKCPKVIVAGLERRFCQQCSRFHSLSEFDEKKRSCRRRLSDHNARRRKPHPEPARLHPTRLSSSLYDQRQHMNLVWDRGPLLPARPNANSILEDPFNTGFTITKESMLKPSKVGNIDGQLHLCGNGMANATPMQRQGSNGLFVAKVKGTASEAFNQGLEESLISYNVDTTQDIQRALSLLSTNSWGSKSASPQLPLNMSTCMPVSHAIPQGLPLATSDYWRTEQHSTDSRVDALTSHSDGSSYFQEFQLLRTPYDSDFYSTQLN